MRSAPVLLSLLCAALASAHEGPIRVGSKAFTESVILGEVLTQALEARGIPAVHRKELGGTKVLWDALRSGQLDAYVEYTGTLSEEILSGKVSAKLPALQGALRPLQIGLTSSLGFDDAYVLGMKEATAGRMHVSTLSDLSHHPELRLGLSNEFMARMDGLPALQRKYGWAPAFVQGMDHSLAYRALDQGAIDATDLYSTDAEIQAYHLRVLVDDRHVFPAYLAVVVFRQDLPGRVVEALKNFEGRISQEAMIGMNARAKQDHIPEGEVAAEFLRGQGVRPVAGKADPAWRRLGERTREHLFLVSVSLFAAICLGVPLGVLAARKRRVGQVILAFAGVLQTLPSLALLVFMIPLLGIGAKPALAALFLYSLLPIVRNTHAGLTGIAPDLRESALALGLPFWPRLLRVELPLAAGAILSGVQIAAIIDVGTATLGALIGAGGYGQPILTGIRLNRMDLIFEGALPAAVMALGVQGLFEGIERWLGLRRRSLKPPR